MIVIARVKAVVQEEATEDNNTYGLKPRETFFSCKVDKLEHIVGFEGDEYVYTDYACY